MLHNTLIMVVALAATAVPSASETATTDQLDKRAIAATEALAYSKDYEAVAKAVDAVEAPRPFYLTQNVDTPTGHKEKVDVERAAYRLPEDVVRGLKAFSSTYTPVRKVSGVHVKTVELHVTVEASTAGALESMTILYPEDGPESVSLRWTRKGEKTAVVAALTPRKDIILASDDARREAVKALAAELAGAETDDAMVALVEPTLAQAATERGHKTALAAALRQRSGVVGRLLSGIDNENAAFAKEWEGPNADDKGEDGICVLSLPGERGRVHVCFEWRPRVLAWVRGTYLHASIVSIDYEAPADKASDKAATTAALK